MDTIRTLFSRTGIILAVYFLLGVFINTAPPHLPTTSTSSFGLTLHSWIQYAISIFLWPLSFWHPVFTTGHWHP